MPRYICKIHDQGNDWYLEWEIDLETGVHAPVTPGMTLDDFKRYYSNRYGPRRLLPGELDKRLERVDAKGTSAFDYTLDELIASNRAGKDGTRLTREQIVDWYIRHRDECKRGDPCPLEGSPTTA